MSSSENIIITSGESILDALDIQASSAAKSMPLTAQPITRLVSYLNILLLTLLIFTEIFFHALDKYHYKCPLGPHQALPMIYIDDCINATVQYLKAPKENLKRRVYNLGGISFTPEAFAKEVMKLIPGLKVEYDPCPIRSKIADNWPRKLDDTYAK